MEAVSVDHRIIFVTTLIDKFIFRFSPLIKIGRKSSSSVGVDNQDFLQHAEFVADQDGKIGVIFVADNNIYHMPSLQNRKWDNHLLEQHFCPLKHLKC